MKFNVKSIMKQTEFYVLCIIIAFSVIIQVRSGQFFTSNNLMDLIRSMIIPAIYALCALLSFVSTGADVSFPLIAALSAYIAVTLGNNFSLGVIPIFIIAIGVGCLIGCINGFFIVKYKFNSLIVTLGTSSICSGILFGAFEAGRTELPDKLYKLSKINIATVTNAKSGLSSSLPVTFIIMIVLYVIAYLILNYTMAGRSVYAVGGDEVSAQRAGINVGKVRFLVFVVNGGIAAIAGLCYAMMSYFYLPNEYAGAEMLVIAAVILGGTRMTGGIGTLRGCLLGTLLLTMVANSLILLGISVYWEKVFIGAIIIIGTATLSMTDDNVKEATKRAIETAKNNGLIISFDPNLRPPLWKSLDDARNQIAYGLSQCDVLKISDNEIEFMTGTSDFDKGANILMERYPNIKLLNITAGADGSYSYYREIRAYVPSYLLGGTIDTTGAGDTFCGSVLNYLLDHDLENLSKENLIEMLQIANAAAYLVTTKKGAIRSMPDPKDVQKVVNNNYIRED